MTTKNGASFNYDAREIILIASDRETQRGEHCVVTSNGGIYIVVKSRKRINHLHLNTRYRILKLMIKSDML